MPLKAYQRKTGIYHIRGTFEGKRVDQSARTKRREIAEQVIRSIEKDILDAKLHGEHHDMTFAAAVNHYLDAGGDGRFLRPLVEVIGLRAVAKIGQTDFDEVAKTAYPDAAPATINRQVYTPGGAVIRFAADQGWRPAVGRIRRRKVKTKPKPWLKVWQAARILRFAGKYRPLITLGLESGCRISELLRLRWAQVELEGGRLHLWENKSDTYRIAYFGERSRRELSALPHRDGRVFLTESGEPYKVAEGSGSTMQGAFKRISEASGVRVTPHVLRHTAATWGYAVTKDLLAVRDGGGWASLALLEVYTKLSPPGYRKRVIGAGWEPFGRRGMDD